MIPMDMVSEKKDENLYIKLGGSLTVQHATTLHRNLLNLVSKKENLYINLENVTEIDTAGIQLLLALKREFQNTDRILVYHSHSPALLSIMDLYGLVNVFADPVRLTIAERKNYYFTYGTRNPVK